MNKIWKYGVFPIGIFFFLLLATVMLLPILVDVQRFVPAIEERLGTAMGRPVSLGQDMTVSFFPSPSLTFSDLKIGNPPGFASDALVTIDSFEARLKLLPLLIKEIHFSRFVVGGLEINLEQNGEGRDNWRTVRLPGLDVLQDNVTCSLFAVADGRVNWIDGANHVRHSLDKLMLLVNTAQQGGQAAIDFKASYAGRPIALEGKIGPLLGQGDQTLPLDVGFHLLETLQGQVQGKIENLGTNPVSTLTLNLSPFSPRQLLAAQGIPFPIEPADATTFQVAGLDLVVKGRRDGLIVEKGTARLDDTTMVFSGEVKKTAEPELAFSLAIDHLDLDRYIRLGDRQGLQAPGIGHDNPAEALVARLAKDSTLAGTLSIQTLKMYGVTGAKVQSAVGAKGGVLTFDPVSMQLYGGQLAARLVADLSGEMPNFTVGAQSQGLEAGTMLRQIAGREIMTGTVAGDMTLAFAGNSSAERQTSLTGQASMTCLDGAILGIDLSRVVKRRKSAEGGSAMERQGVRTDFAELRGAMDIQNGQLNIRRATLVSPALALTILGGASIPERVWSLQIAPQAEEPKPATGKGTSISPLTLAGTFERVGDQPDHRLQPAAETPGGTGIGDEEKKRDMPLASGRIRINPLLEETTL